MSKKVSTGALDTSKASRFVHAEAKENECIALAYDLVEQRLRDGTATSQETTHFLRMGSAKEKREALLLEKQLELMEAKKQSLEAAKRIEALYSEAIKAVQSYGSPVTMGGDDPHA